ncbi:MAG: PilZ domain-containing protein, partial [Acidobacteria bacterium]|nr:PilZ domain-containing protein [Acidobacteriota bacterium]
MLINDRRGKARVLASIDASWEGLIAQCGGLVVDLSEAGCFILTSDRVTAGETVWLEMRPSTGERVGAWGEVVYQVPEMGFALRFVEHDN